MRSKRALASSLFFLLLFVTACDRDSGVVDEPPDDPESLLAQIQTEIFDVDCATSGCHAGSGSFGGLDLSSVDDSYTNLVGVPATLDENLLRVDPGNPDESFLIHKLEGTGAGSQMPLNAQPLSDDEIQLVRDWIAEGAPRS